MSFGKEKSSSGGFDPELKQALLGVFKEGQNIFKNRKYTPYNSATVAPLSNIEMAGMQGVVNAAQQGYGQQQMRDGMNTARNESMYNPGQVRAQGIGNQNVGVQGIGHRDVRVQGIGSRDVRARGIGSRDVSMVGPSQQIREERVAGPYGKDMREVGLERLSNTNYDPYQNKFNEQVVDTTLADIERARQMQQNQNSARAIGAGAFGGDREAIVRSETNKAALDQVARSSAALRSSGFDKSTNMAQSDIANFMKSQQLNQATDLSAGQFSQGQMMQRNLANQQANLAAQNSNTSNDLARSKLNMQGQISNQRTNFDAQKQNQMANLQAQLANQRTNYDAQRQNQMARLQAGQGNQRVNFDAQRQNQMARLQAGQGNQRANLDAQKSNQMAYLQAAMQNQNAGLKASQQRLGAAKQLGSMGQDYRNLMFQDPAAMMGVGKMQRDQAQRLMSDQYNRFQEGRDYDLKMFDVLRGAAGILPSPLTNKSKGKSTSIGL